MANMDVYMYTTGEGEGYRRWCECKYSDCWRLSGTCQRHLFRIHLLVHCPLSSVHCFQLSPVSFGSSKDQRWPLIRLKINVLAHKSTGLNLFAPMKWKTHVFKSIDEIRQRSIPDDGILPPCRGRSGNYCPILYSLNNDHNQVFLLVVVAVVGL